MRLDDRVSRRGWPLQEGGDGIVKDGLGVRRGTPMVTLEERRIQDGRRELQRGCVMAPRRRRVTDLVQEEPEADVERRGGIGRDRLLPLLAGLGVAAHEMEQPGEV